MRVWEGAVSEGMGGRGEVTEQEYKLGHVRVGG